MVLRLMSSHKQYSPLKKLKKNYEEDINRNHKQCHSPPRVVLNIAGAVFETFDSTLTRFPTTLLGDAEKRAPFYCSFSGEYYFDRNRGCFDWILYFYQSRGELKCPPEMPMQIFKEECEYFEIPEEAITRMVERSQRCTFHIKESVPLQTNNKDKLLCEKVWDFLENPSTSRPAKLFAFVSFFVVVISVVTSTLETIAAFHQEGTDLDNHWVTIDLTINIWFLVELLARATFARSKVDFLKNYANWFDCIAVVPYFLLLLFSRQGLHSVYHHRYLRVPRFARIFRLLRMSKYSRRIRIVGEIIKASAKDLQLLMLCACVVITFGGSIIYVVEEHYNPLFSSTPQSLWWAVQTLTTVGYGDVIPITVSGKVIATCLMMFGAGTMTLPILGIVTKFVSAYQHIEDPSCEKTSNDVRIIEL